MSQYHKSPQNIRCNSLKSFKLWNFIWNEKLLLWIEGRIYNSVNQPCSLIFFVSVCSKLYFSLQIYFFCLYTYNCTLASFQKINVNVNVHVTFLVSLSYGGSSWQHSLRYIFSTSHQTFCRLASLLKVDSFLGIAQSFRNKF